MNKSFDTQCNLRKFSALIANKYYHRCTYLIYGIYTNFRRLLCKKSVTGYYVINDGVYRIRSCVIKFLRQNKGQTLGKRISVEKLEHWQFQETFGEN